MEMQPLSCCRPNKIHVLLALVPRHPSILVLANTGGGTVGNKAIVPKCLGRIGLENEAIVWFTYCK